MSTAPDFFSSANRSSALHTEGEITSRRIASLFAAVRKHQARTGRGLGLHRHDDALHRHARGLYESH